LAHPFDHRFSTYEGATQEQLNVGALPRLDETAHTNPDFSPLPRYWVSDELVDEKLAGDAERGKVSWDHPWLLGWRDIARSTDARTLIAAIVPRVGVGHTMPLAISQLGAKHMAGLVANLNSYCLDYAVRQCLSGTHLTYTVMKQLPVLTPESYGARVPWDNEVNDLGEWITRRTLELVYTAYDINGFARELGDDDPPFVWEDARRTLLRAELDAAYFQLYGIARVDVDYIMDTFVIVQDREEQAYGEFRTKRLILEAYDAMQKAIDTGEPFLTALDPQPGQGRRHPDRGEVLR
jgi:hypothetical protein